MKGIEVRTAVSSEARSVAAVRQQVRRLALRDVKRGAFLSLR